MTTDVDTRLRDAHAAIPDPDADTIARARARLAVEMAAADEPRAGEAGEASPRGPRRRRRARLRIVLPLAALAAAGVVAVLALTPTRVKTPVAPPAAEAAKIACAPAGAPARCLRALSAVAGARQGLADGLVFYQRNTFMESIRYIGKDGRPSAYSNAGYAIARSVPEEMWLAADGSGRFLYGDDSAPYLPSAKDEAAWKAAGSPDLDTLAGKPGEWGPKDQRFKSSELDASLLLNSNLEAVLPKDDPLSVLPHDPAKLAAWLHEAAAKQRPEGPQSNIDNTFGTDVTTFLRYPRTPPDLRAALLEVLATLPGAKALGTIKDGAGRAAAGIQLPPDSNDGMNVIAFDPRTSELLAEGMSVGDGSVRWNHVYNLQNAAVKSIGDRP